MEKEMIHEMFSRSISKYEIKYSSYIGDGDAKVHKYLVDNPPYSNVTIKKLEDVNHFSKRMFNRILKVKKANKNKILSDGKKFSGKGRMTDNQAIKFKIYFGKAIRECKSDLQKLYERSWAIFKHHYSTNEKPMHEWCDIQWCKYLQATSNGEQFDHNSCSTIPRACLDLVKPVFEEICSYSSLARVVGGGSQNCNESFHSVLWTMVPKHRYCSSTMIRIGLALSTIIFNDGYSSLDKLFINLFTFTGYYSHQCFVRLDEMKNYFRSKVKKRHAKKIRTTTATVNDISSSENDDDDTLLNSNNNSLADVSNALNALDLSFDDMNIDYEAGGDE